MGVEQASPMMILVSRDAQQFGPYTLEEVNTYLTQGTLFPTDQAWYEGLAEMDCLESGCRGRHSSWVGGGKGSHSLA